MAPPIPDGWTSYRPIGNRIEGTRFIAFKVPLRSNVSESVEKMHRLDEKILLREAPDLGLIIDLTNTTRYYDPNDFKRQGIEYRKLMIPGHHTPPKELVKKFIDYVADFLADNKNNDKLIGVHCTHGVNRTGYLICNYMISELRMTPAEAIKKFTAGRGHDIDRNNYVEALHDLRKKSRSRCRSSSSRSTHCGSEIEREREKDRRIRDHDERESRNRSRSYRSRDDNKQRLTRDYKQRSYESGGAYDSGSGAGDRNRPVRYSRRDESSQRQQYRNYDSNNYNNFNNNHNKGNFYNNSYNRNRGHRSGGDNGNHQYRHHGFADRSEFRGRERDNRNQFNQRRQNYQSHSDRNDHHYQQSHNNFNDRKDRFYSNNNNNKDSNAQYYRNSYNNNNGNSSGSSNPYRYNSSYKHNKNDGNSSNYRYNNSYENQSNNNNSGGNTYRHEYHRSRNGISHQFRPYMRQNAHYNSNDSIHDSNYNKRQYHHHN